eukprot:Phypoly_transcript_05726.p1 GENE.Phypoly_transcript_05726~~Phypoly_transcript_05726.p1  ORF type:complete len:428 (+),score=90.24 Phypoly_transcript_05726:605-1888(+)
MASDVEYRIREITQEAIKFMKRSKREVLTTDDINSALRLRNVEALYGYSARTPIKFRRVVGTSDLYYIADKELEFPDLINAPLPKCPRDVCLTSHWLAIEGVQPSIPQNPSAADQAAAAPKKQKLEPASPLPPGAAAGASATSSTETPSTTTTDASGVPTEVKPIVKHVLSKEMQLYFEKITAAIKGKDEEIIEAALNSLRSDPSLHQLLPYFTQFISDKVTHNLRNLPQLKNLMKMVQAILDSPFLHVEPYLHQMMPPILTCLVGKTLGDNPMANHWELRDFSASLVALICKRYGTTYTSIQPRITKTLTAALQDISKPLTTHYGAIVGIASLGYRAVEQLLLPTIKAYMQVLMPETESENAVKRTEATKVHEALLNAVGGFLSHTSASSTNGTKDPSLEKYYEELYDIFGESLLPFVKKPQDPST